MCMRSRHIADALDFSGVWLLNASMQWGCTSRANEQDGVPWLLRTLDWPFHGLGRHTELARMSGDRRRFCQRDLARLCGRADGNGAATLRRRAQPGADVAADRGITGCGPAISPSMPCGSGRADGRMPPDQFLRQAFETCAIFDAARAALEETPCRAPVIYTLVGCAPRERCVIERTDDDFVTREDDTCAANDWVPCRPGWEGRIGTRRFLVCSFAEAAG